MRLFVNLITALILASFLPVGAMAQTGQISLTGTGQVVVEPDMAIISVGVTKQARTAAQAVDLMAVDLALVIEALVAAGVAETNIQTSQVRVNPEYNYNNGSGQSRLTGYSAGSNLTVRVGDLGSLPRILDAVVEQGANQLNGLQFDVADRVPHLETARRAAVADARRKAEIYADAAGVTLGQLVALSEAGGSRGPVMMADMAMARSESVPVMAGEIRIEAQINVIYAIAE